MRLTKEQVKTWNKKAGNDFKLDVQYAVVWGDKVLHKFINLGEKEILEARLLYMENYDADGDRYYIPIMRFQKWHDEGEMMSSNGYGKKINVGVAVVRRNFNRLLEYSHKDEFDNESLIKLYSEVVKYM